MISISRILISAMRFTTLEAFGIGKAGSSPLLSLVCASSSACSSTSRSSRRGKKKTSNNFYKKPCLALHVHKESATILLITRFHQHDPASIVPKGKVMSPGLSRPFLFKLDL